MHAQLVKPRDPLLGSVVESFLCQWTDAPAGAYTTFPNTNLCLALYQGNEAQWDRAANACRVESSPRAWSSRLYGFHQRPFQVAWHGPVRQVNILFRPGALSRFTRMPLRLIDAVDDPFSELFGTPATDVAEQVFSGSTIEEQVGVLERFLRAQLLDMTPQGATVQGIMRDMSRCTMDAGPPVRTQALRMRTSPSTIYRAFMDVVGQAPQAFFKTVRFRQALRTVLSTREPGTAIALDHGYYDQAHFIREMRRFAGTSPQGIRRNAEVVPGGFVWVRP